MYLLTDRLKSSPARAWLIFVSGAVQLLVYNLYWTKSIVGKVSGEVCTILKLRSSFQCNSQLCGIGNRVVISGPNKCPIDGDVFHQRSSLIPSGTYYLRGGSSHLNDLFFQCINFSGPKIWRRFVDYWSPLNAKCCYVRAGGILSQ